MIGVVPPALHHATCALDCPDACSLLVSIEDGRATRLRGNPDHPITQGFLCAKVANYLERQYHPDRLTTPLRRTGPKGARTSPPERGRERGRNGERGTEGERENGDRTG